MLDCKHLFKEWYIRVNTYIRNCSIWKYIRVKHIRARTYQSFKVSELNTIRWIRARLIPRIRAWLISEFESIIALSDLICWSIDTWKTWVRTPQSQNSPWFKYYPIRRIYYQNLRNIWNLHMFSLMFLLLCFSPYSRLVLKYFFFYVLPLFVIIKKNFAVWKT